MVEMNDFENALDSAISKSVNMTEKEIADDIAANCKLKRKEILKLFPARTDLVKFKKLCMIINSDDSEEIKTKKIQQNFMELSLVILKFLESELAV